MSGNPFDEFPSSPRKLLSGAARPSANPRIHSIQKPYSRPVSYAGPSSTASPQHELLNVNGSNGNGNGSPTKPAPKTRPAILTSQSQRAFPRSGSESSLFGSLKGLISKPLSWLATPRSAKRDQTTWGAGLDSEDPESPSVKKLRRASPPRQRGTYDIPARGNGNGGSKEKEREMLPPLPALGGLKKLPTTKAISNLPHSQSMPYLDPPSSVLSPARRKGGAMTRSRGMDLASLANGDDEETLVEDKGTWSPWKQQAGGRARTPLRQNRGSISDIRDVSLLLEDGADDQYALPSLSPFRAPPPASASATGGLSRSNTANNLRRAGSMASDISMGRQSTTTRQMKGSSSMLFGNSASTAGDADESMSVDGAERTRDGSVLVSLVVCGCADGSRIGSCAIGGQKNIDRLGQIE
jgi:nucleoporin NUP1